MIKNNHPKKERTLVIIKPDGIQRALMGEIIHRLERTGLKFVGFKFLVATDEQCLTHYNKDDTWFKKVGERTVKEKKANGEQVQKSEIEYGKDILKGNVDFMTAGPVFAAVLQGNQAVGIVKKIVGGTEPLTSDVGTIRGDFTIDSYALSGSDERCVRNLIHCSDSPEEAEREISIWFKDGELINYRLINEEILYDVNLDGILE